VKVFGTDFNSVGGALTLSASEVTDGSEDNGKHKRTHSDGWTIEGEIHEDYFTWVNEFKAHHPMYRRVWGNFEDKVYADSEEGFKHFMTNHSPEAWDYDDI